MTQGSYTALGNLRHLELWVGNALQASFYYRKAFGFSQVAYSGPETGDPRRVSYQLEQGGVRLVVTSSLGDREVADFVARHGDSVKDVAFSVPDVEELRRMLVSQQSELPDSVVDIAGPGAQARRVTIRMCGDLTHSFYEDIGRPGVTMPRLTPRYVSEPGCGIYGIDHIVLNVPQGQMREWSSRYARLFGLLAQQTFSSDVVRTSGSSLQSEVMATSRFGLRINVNEPGVGRLRSHIQEYLDKHEGPGVQHIAMLTRNAVQTVKALRDRGVTFLEVENGYYATMQQCPFPVSSNRETLREQGLLLDWDDHGYLIQNFTEPVQDRPTLFYEIIQREGAQTFGVRTFNTLFAAMEKAQLERGYE